MEKMGLQNIKNIVQVNRYSVNFTISVSRNFVMTTFVWTICRQDTGEVVIELADGVIQI